MTKHIDSLFTDKFYDMIMTVKLKELHGQQYAYNMVIKYLAEEKIFALEDAFDKVILRLNPEVIRIKDFGDYSSLNN